MNIKSLSYKQKSFILLIVILLLTVLSYYLSIKKTLEVYQSNKELAKQLQTVDGGEKLLAELEKNIDQLNQLLVISTGREELQILLFNELSNTCNDYNVLLAELERVGTTSEKGLILETFEVKIIGGYKSLVKVVNILECHLKYGKIASASYLLEKNRKRNCNQLVLKLYIQSAVKKD